MKKCSNPSCDRAEQDLPETDFHKNNATPDGLAYRCKICIKQYGETYRTNNKEKIKTGNKRYYEGNKDRIFERDRIYKEKNKNRIKEYKQQYYQEHKQEINEYVRYKKDTDIGYRLANNLRNRLGQAIKHNYKAGSAIEDLGCSIDELKQHLEARFYSHPETGEMMTWENWSRTGWHIDHITPLDDFDLEDREQFLKACHYTNLQPLWWFQNLIKGNKSR